MKKYNPEKGAFVISLDFEKYWGMRDKKSIDAYRSNLEGVDEVVKHTLSLFQSYDIRATWATVGFLCCKNFEELVDNLPKQKPAYADDVLNPYHYIKELNNASCEPKVHFASDSIKNIIETPGQEFSCHTYSHLYFLEEDVDEVAIRSDLEAFISKAKTLGVSADSIVFPRNQYDEQTLNILREVGIKAYRGNEKSWLYRPSKDEEQTKLRRSIRLLDSMVNISGHHTSRLEQGGGLINIPSSRFLRPVSGRLKLINKLQTNRIKGSMEYAAKHSEVFHLWWHPHNFGRLMDQSFERLRELLEFQKILKEKYGFQSLNMKDFIS